MKQLFQDVRTGEVTLRDVPAPAAAPGRVVVQARASAVSVGTERRISEFAQSSLLGKACARPDLVRQVLAKLKRDGPLALWDSVQERMSQPLPLGYSCAGVVVEAGEGVSIPAGAKVACAGVGYACHAEFVSVPENLCAVLPGEGPAFEEASFSAIASCALHGFRLADLKLGESAAVIGLGLLGQFACQFAKAAGCRVFALDPDPDRRGLAAKLWADQAVPREGAEEAAAAFTGGRGFDAVLIAADTTSNDPVELAGAIARDRGAVVSIGTVGMTLPRAAYFRKELSFKVSRSYGPGRYDPLYEEGGLDYPVGFVRWTERRNLEEILRLMSLGSVRCAPMITHRYPLEEAQKAYRLIMEKGGEPFLGVALSYGDAPSVEKRVDIPKSAEPLRSGLSLGVLGAGTFATAVMLPLIKRSGTRLRGIACPSGTKAQAAAERYGFAFASSDEKAVLEDKEAAAVAIFTRHRLHARQVLAALAAGKHVFVEKPLCLEPADLDAIGEARSKAGLVLSVGFNRRFAPYTLALKEHFAGLSGPLSLSIRINAGTLPPGHWILDPAEGGGRLLGEGCHFIDWAGAIVGSAPSVVDCRPIGRKAGEQDWSLRLSYPDGSVADILYVSDGADGAGKERFEVHGGGRSAVLEDFRILRLHAFGTKTLRAWLRSDKGHAAQWRAFCGAVEKGGPSPVPWKEILGTMRAVFSARRSLQSGRAEVLPVDP